MGRYKLFENETFSSLDDLKFFRVLGELKSFRKAAAMLNTSPQRLTRRMETLEMRAGVTLFVRTNTGVTLTAEGEHLFEELGDFWQSAMIAEKRLTQTGKDLRGEVIIWVTEGLGTFWLTPRIAELLRDNDYMTIYLIADMALGKPDRGDCDISISLDKPTNPDLIVKRLGYMHVMPFASPDYIEKHGRPESLKDMLNHRFVEQVSEQVPFERMKKVLGGKPEEGFAAIRTNTSSAHFWAVAKGAGVGLLPTYIRAVTRKVTPVDLDYRIRRDIWVSFTKESRRVKRISEVLEFLTSSFDAKRYPWFGEEFAHPNEIEKHFASEEGDYYFEGFVERKTSVV